MRITDVVVDAVLVSALLPVVISFTSNVTGATPTEQLLLALVGVFIVIGLIISVARQTGAMHDGM